MSRLSTEKILAVRDINDTPRLPSYYSTAFGRRNCPSGMNHYQSGKKWMPCKKSSFGKKKKKTNTQSKCITHKHIQSMAKYLKIKQSVKGKKKTTRRLWGDVSRKGKSILKAKENDKMYKYMIKHCKMMAKKLKIKQSKKSPLVIWGQITKKALTYEEVTKKRTNVKTKKSNTKVRKPKPRKSKFGKTTIKMPESFGWPDCDSINWKNFAYCYPKQSLDGIYNGTKNYLENFCNDEDDEKRTSTRSSVSMDNQFGNWWDNTQHDYAAGCASQQCADASTLGGNYPFYEKGGWKPYYPIKSPAFGSRSSFGDMYEYAPGYGMKGYMPNAYEPEFRKYSYGIDIPRQPSWPTYSNLGTYPNSVNSPYPFKMAHKRW